MKVGKINQLDSDIVDFSDIKKVIDELIAEYEKGELINKKAKKSTYKTCRCYGCKNFKKK